MKEVTLDDFENNFDAYQDMIEAGEKIMIVQPDGRKVVAVPAKELAPETEHMTDEEWYNIYKEHSEGS